MKCLKCNKNFESRNRKAKFCSIPCSNRYNLNNKKIFKKPKKHSKELAELFGILLGDGSVTKYYARIYLNIKADKGYAKNVVKIISSALPDTETKIMRRVSRGTEEVQISSKDVCSYLRSTGFDPKIRSVPSWITKNKQFSIHALRGLFDTEGSIGFKYFKGSKGEYLYKQLTFTNTNIHIMNFVRENLTRLGFSPTHSWRHNIYISNKNDIEKYFKLVGTSNPKLEKKYKIK